MVGFPQLVRVHLTQPFVALDVGFNVCRAKPSFQLIHPFQQGLLEMG